MSCMDLSIREETSFAMVKVGSSMAWLHCCNGHIERALKVILVGASLARLARLAVKDESTIQGSQYYYRRLANCFNM